MRAAATPEFSTRQTVGTKCKTTPKKNGNEWGDERTSHGSSSSQSLRADPLKRAGGEKLAKSEKSETDLNECGADPRWMLARAAHGSSGHGAMGVANGNFCMRFLHHWDDGLIGAICWLTLSAGVSSRQPKLDCRGCLAPPLSSGRNRPHDSQRHSENDYLPRCEMRHSDVLLPARRVAIMPLSGVSAAPTKTRRRRAPLHFSCRRPPLSTQHPAICGFPRQPQGKLWLRARIPVSMIDDGMIPVAAADGRTGPVDEGTQIARPLHQAVTRQRGTGEGSTASGSARLWLPDAACLPANTNIASR